MRLILVPVDFATAKAFVAAHHSHHEPPISWKFGVGAAAGEQLVGVIIAGRPASRVLDDGSTIEATRCCTDRTRNVASLLYGAINRARKALGYRRAITYTLASEDGTSLKAAGWKAIRETKGGSWDTPARRRGAGLAQQALFDSTKPRQEGRKVLWVAP